MHPRKTSALRLNLETILADHSEEFDSLPASLTLQFSGSGKFDSAASTRTATQGAISRFSFINSRTLWS